MQLLSIKKSKKSVDSQENLKKDLDNTQNLPDTGSQVKVQGISPKFSAERKKIAKRSKRKSKKVMVDFTPFLLEMENVLKYGKITEIFSDTELDLAKFQQEKERVENELLLHSIFSSEVNYVQNLGVNMEASLQQHINDLNNQAVLPELHTLTLQDVTEEDILNGALLASDLTTEESNQLYQEYLELEKSSPAPMH
jgi:hypothetical protein